MQKIALLIAWILSLVGLERCKSCGFWTTRGDIQDGYPVSVRDLCSTCYRMYSNEWFEEETKFEISEFMEAQEARRLLREPTGPVSMSMWDANAEEMGYVPVDPEYDHVDLRGHRTDHLPEEYKLPSFALMTRWDETEYVNLENFEDPNAWDPSLYARASEALELRERAMVVARRAEHLTEMAVRAI